MVFNWIPFYCAFYGSYRIYHFWFIESIWWESMQFFSINIRILASFHYLMSKIIFLLFKFLFGLFGFFFLSFFFIYFLFTHLDLCFNLRWSTTLAWRRYFWGSTRRLRTASRRAFITVLRSMLTNLTFSDCPWFHHRLSRVMKIAWRCFWWWWRLMLSFFVFVLLLH